MGGAVGGPSRGGRLCLVKEGYDSPGRLLEMLGAGGKLPQGWRRGGGGESDGTNFWALIRRGEVAHNYHRDRA